MRASLSERENILLDKVHQIATEKKKKLEVIANGLRMQSTQCQKVIFLLMNQRKKNIFMRINSENRVMPKIVEDADRA